MAVDAQRMLQVAGRRLVSADERFREASFALDALTTLAGDSEKYGFYDVLRLESRLRQALFVPTSAAQAARVLGLLGSPGAQQALIELRSATGVTNTGQRERILETISQDIADLGTRSPLAPPEKLTICWFRSTTIWGG